MVVLKIRREESIFPVALSSTARDWCTSFSTTCIRCENVCARRRCRRSLLLLCADNAIDPLQRVVFDLDGVGVCGRVDLVRARVRTMALVEMGATRRVAAAVRDRVFRAGAIMSTGVCIDARRFARFRVGTLVIGADTLGRGCVTGAINRVMRRFSSSPFVANTLGTGRWLSSTSVVKRLGFSHAACVVRRTSCCNWRILGSFLVAVIPLTTLVQSAISVITLSAWLTCEFVMFLCCK